MRALQAAYKAYDTALEVSSHVKSPIRRAKLKIAKGSALWNVGQHLAGDAAIAALREAVIACDAAIEESDLNERPDDRAAARMHRGNALLFLAMRIGGNEGISACRAGLAAYDAALEIVPRAEAAEVWAEIQQNRANALTWLGERLGGRTGIELLRESVSACDAALEVSTRVNAPDNWSLTQMNRGNALSSLGQRLEGANSILAYHDSLASYGFALEVATREALPETWARVLLNRAILLRHFRARLSGDQGIAALRGAISDCNAALEILTRDSMPTDWALGQEALATVLHELGERLDEPAGTASLHESLATYDAALAVVERATMPSYWALLQNNRAGVLLSLGVRSGQGASAAWSEVIAAYEACQEIWTRESMPSEWALTQVNRVGALSRLADASDVVTARNHRENIVSIVPDIIQFFKERGETERELDLSRLLVRSLMRLDRWSEAGTAALTIIRRFPVLIAEPIAQKDVRERLDKVDGIGDLAAYALAMAGRYREAMVAADEGRAQLLRNHLRFIEAALSPEKRVKLESARRRLADARAEFERTRNDARMLMDTNRSLHAVSSAHRDFTVELENCGLHSRDQAIHDDWEDLAAASPKNHAVVMICITTFGAVAFVVPGGTSEPQAHHTLFLNGFTTGRFRELLRNGDNSGWLDGYAAFRMNLEKTEGGGSADGIDAWDRIIGKTLEMLWHELMEPIDKKLRTPEFCLPPQCEVSLIVPGRLSLLPLHAAGRWTQDRWDCFLDRWIPTYCPSVSVLARLLARRIEPLPDALLLAITDPTENINAVYNPAVSYFEVFTELAGKEASLKAVAEALPSADYISFFCHGEWNPNEPEQSALILANDERLSLAVLSELTAHRHPFIALAACETSLPGFDEAPDEHQGLPAAFLRAGARAVAATFWPVFAHVAHQILSGLFEKHRRGGLRPSEALRASIIAMRDGMRNEENVTACASIGQARKEKGILNAPETQFDAPPKRAWKDRVARQELLRDMTRPVHWAVYGMTGI